MKIQIPSKILLLSVLLFAVLGCGGAFGVSQGTPTTSASSTAASSVSLSGATPTVGSTPAKSDLAATPVSTLRVETATGIPFQTAIPPTPRLIFASTSKPPLDWGQLMVQKVQLPNTAYEHRETLVTWAGVNGATEYSSYADCSGFLNALLTQAYGLAADDFKNWLGARRPLAKDYYTAMTTQRGFRAITNIANIQPGDIIAIRYLNDAPGDNTGHVLLVAAIPQHRTSTKPIVNATQQWDVPIIDSSESGHGKDDTRRLADGSYHDGVGRGILRLYADGSGALVGYAWSDLTDSLYYDGTARPLAIGRLDPKFSLP